MTLGDGCGGGQGKLLLALLLVEGGGIVQLVQLFDGDGRAGRVHAQVFRFGLLRQFGFDVGDLLGRPDGAEVHGGLVVEGGGFRGTEVQGKGQAGVLLVQHGGGFEVHGEVGHFGTAGPLVAHGG